MDEIFFIIVLYNHPLVILGFLSLFLEVSLGKNVVSLPPCFGGGGILDVGPALGQ